MMSFMRLFKFFMLLFALFCAKSGFAHISLQFISDAENITNPERGFFHHVELRSSGLDSYNFSDLMRWRAAGVSTLFTAIILDSCRDGQDIPAEMLENIKSNFSLLRDAGFKTVLRFCYSYGENDYPRDMPWTVTSRHIDQLAPIIKNNSDVIALLEAGFIGAWGEWYYTDNYGFEPTTYTDYAPRRRLLEKLLEILPADRCVAVRYPRAKAMIFNRELNNPITECEAFSDTDYARVAFHNDCFLANEDHMGTGLSDYSVRNYLETETRYLAMGGETCADPNNYTEYSNALSEMKKYHWTYINEDYHPAVVEQWKDNGLFKEAQLHLGYRIELTQLDAYNFAPGYEATVKIKFLNSGYAAPINPRPIYIIFEGNGKSYRFNINIDPRRLFPGISDFTTTFTLPDDMPQDEYKMYLHLPDACETLSDRPEYSIRLANIGVWEETTGRNLLGVVKVSSENSGENPDPPTTGETVAVLWSGTCVIPAWGNRNPDVRISPEYFTLADLGMELVFDVKILDPTKYAQIEVDDYNWNKGLLSESRPITPETTEIAYPLTDETVRFLKSYGIEVTGENFSMSRIYLRRISSNSSFSPYQQNDKTIIREFDLFGRPYSGHGLRIRVYSDGTVQKRLLLLSDKTR